MNCILIILDSWRQDHVGAYGNPWIRTPHLDWLAAQSVRFTRAYPESLPTLPVRRALQTGKRTYPFNDHWLQKGDFVGAPGWGPVEEDLPTMAELLQTAGWRTAFLTDTYHQFKPSKNFHRGFDEWQWIRGQESDAFRSGPPTPPEVVARHTPAGAKAERAVWIDRYLRNQTLRQSEEDYLPARVFREGADWLYRNQDAERFFLVLDSFDPHEPWDPPLYYRRMYDRDEHCADVIWSTYGPADYFTDRELVRLQANYAGECTLVDRWLGHFLEALVNSGRWEDTVIGVVSDHGHNLGYGPTRDMNLTGKQGHPLTRAVADLIMLLRPPAGERAGTTCEALCYNMDLTATLLTMLGQPLPAHMTARDLWPALTGAAPGRDHVTVAWGPEVTCVDDRWWCNATIAGEKPLLFDLAADPGLTTDVAAQHPEVVARAVQTFCEDAGGAYPEYLAQQAGMPGCTPIL